MAPFPAFIWTAVRLVGLINSALWMTHAKADQSRCPRANAIAMSYYTGRHSCFYVYGGQPRLTRSACQRWCGRVTGGSQGDQSGQLAEILDDRTNAFVEDLLISKQLFYSSQFWIGLSDAAAAGVYKWDGTRGDPLKYENWAAGEPSKGTENRHVLTTHLGWKKVNEDERHCCLCEVRPGVPQSTAKSLSALREGTDVENAASCSFISPPRGLVYLYRPDGTRVAYCHFPRSSYSSARCGTSEPGYSVATNGDTEITLAISDVSMKDDGTWNCTYENRQSKPAQFKIQVYVVPGGKEIASYELKLYSTEENAGTCSFVTRPQGSVYVYRPDGAEVAYCNFPTYNFPSPWCKPTWDAYSATTYGMDAVKLSISRVTVKDEGIWKCIYVENGQLKAAIFEIKVPIVPFVLAMVGVSIVGIILLAYLMCTLWCCLLQPKHRNTTATVRMKTPKVSNKPPRPTAHTETANPQTGSKRDSEDFYELRIP